MAEKLLDPTRYVTSPRVTQRTDGTTEVFWTCNQLLVNAENSAVVLYLDEAKESSLVVLSQSLMRQQVILSTMEGATRLLSINGIEVDAGREVVPDLQSLMREMKRVTYTKAFSHPSSKDAEGKMTDFDYKLVPYDDLARRIRLVVDPFRSDNFERQGRTRSLIGGINNPKAIDGQRAVLENGLWRVEGPKPRPNYS